MKSLDPIDGKSDKKKTLVYHCFLFYCCTRVWFRLYIAFNSFLVPNILLALLRNYFCCLYNSLYHFIASGSDDVLHI